MAQQTTLRDPVARAAREIAQSLLDDASAASASLRDSERHGRAVADDELHAFRVAVRRLRSWQQAFTPWLGEAATHKMKRRISGIAHATGATRDGAVQLSWLNQQRRTLSVRQKPGVAWLIAWLNARQPAHAAHALTAARDFHALAARLGRRLDLSDEAKPARSAADHDRFGVAVAKLVREESHALQNRLASVRNASDDKEAHEARIAAKRLRYLMEPIARAHDDHLGTDAAHLIKQLKQLQDTLGDMHDAHALALIVVSATARIAVPSARRLSETIRDDETGLRSHHAAADLSPGMLGIARRLRRRRLRAFAAIERDWLGGGATPFFSEVRSLGAEVKRRARTASWSGLARRPRGHARTPRHRPKR
ncbi:MAG: CHAD domain-containing protein [Gemmatimonadaceae bacterium]